MVTFAIAVENLDDQSKFLEQLKTELHLCLPYDFIKDVDELIEASLTTLSDAAFHLHRRGIDNVDIHASLARNAVLHEQVLCITRKKLFYDDDGSLPDTVIVDSDTSEEE